MMARPLHLVTSMDPGSLTAAVTRATTTVALTLVASVGCGDAASGGQSAGEASSSTPGATATSPNAPGAEGSGLNAGIPGVAGPGSSAVILINEPDPEPVVTGPGELVEGEVCNSKEVPFEKLQPVVMLLVDRSTSMFGQGISGFAQSPPFGQFPDRWEAVRAAVASLEPLKNDVAFVLATYTGSQQTCPVMQHLDMVPMIGAFDQVLAAVPPSAEAIPDHKGETPTAEALTAAYAALSKLPGDDPKFVMLLTDGQPELCNRLDRGCGFDPAIAEVQAAHAAGIGTFVIGLGEAVLAANSTQPGARFMNDLAHAGVGLEVLPPTSPEINCIIEEARERGTNLPHPEWRGGALSNYALTGTQYATDRFFSPEDADSLQRSLLEITRSVRSCEYQMDSAVTRTQANRGAVQLTLANGTLVDLAFGTVDGWSLAPDNDFTVIVSGSACDQILDQEATGVRIEFPCDIRRPRVL